MKRKSALLKFPICLLFAMMTFFVACAQDGDGPLPVMPNGQTVDGKGFFEGASLDSGKTVHLISDTLYVTLSQIWSFSNCSLTSIELNNSFEDSVLVFSPIVDINVNTDDCPSPMYRPDSTFKVMTNKGIPLNITKIVVKNDVDSLLDSIMLRRGKMELDTFNLFVDSAFANPALLPLRTKESPSVLRVLDSLTPKKFYWRNIRAKCAMTVDPCKNVVADTVYPLNWSEKDTALVPIRSACAFEDSMYCLDSKWEYDSTALGAVNARLDTVWHVSTYYIEDIPECAMVSRFFHSSIVYGKKMFLWRELFVPDESELSCGPSSKKDWVVYNLATDELMIQTENNIVDSLYEIWKLATVANDTLLTGNAESK